MQAYNAQAAVEPDLQLIVGQTVTQAVNDKQQLLPMVEVMEQQSGQRPGNSSGPPIDFAEQIAPNRLTYGG